MSGFNVKHFRGTKPRAMSGGMGTLWTDEYYHKPDPNIKDPNGLYITYPGMYMSMDIDGLALRRGVDEYLARFPVPSTHPDLLTAQAEWLAKDIAVRNAFLASGGIENPIGSAYQPWQEGGGPETFRTAVIGHAFYARYIPLGPWPIPRFIYPFDIKNGKYQMWWGIDRNLGFSTQEIPPPIGQEGGPFRTQNNYMRASLSLFIIDPDGRPLQIYDAGAQRWRQYYLFDPRDKEMVPFKQSREAGNYLPMLYLKVGDLERPILAGEDNYGPVLITELPEPVAREAILSAGLFKEKSQYIVVGDEPSNIAKGVVDLKKFLSAEDYQSLKNFLKMMPRQILRDWFMKKVWPDLPEDYLPFLAGQGMYQEAVYGGGRWEKKKFEDLVWAAFVDVFNESNLEYINQQQIDPWTWEAEKLESYMVSQDKEAVQELQGQIDEFLNVGLALDPKAKVIMEEFALLPKLGDTGLEINRQNAVKQLLKAKDYESAQAIVTAFRYLNESEFGPALKQPVPFDIVAEDGTTIKAT